ncbi:MAG: four helix bundle protein [bacterium]
MPGRPFDLGQRTTEFAAAVMRFTKTLPRTIENIECRKQLVRSAGSVGANYVEASEALGGKDFLMHIRISRKEAKESAYWLGLLSTVGPQMDQQRAALAKEAGELASIFGAIITRSGSRST